MKSKSPLAISGGSRHRRPSRPSSRSCAWRKRTRVTKLDDTDIFVAAKYWADNSDKILADLSARLIKRNLFAVELQDKPFSDDRVQELRRASENLLGINPEQTDYYVFSDSVSNPAYTIDAPEIKILLKSGKTADISEVSDMCDNWFITEKNTKYFLSYPKECR